MTMIDRIVAVLLLLIQILGLISFTSNALTEEYRTEQYHKRGYRWPPSFFIPNTEGWAKLASRRFEQAAFVPTTKEKYDLWIQSVSSAYIQPNFTETGWGLTRAPQDLVDTLRDTIRGAYDEGDYRSEHHVEVIDGKQPLFISRPKLTRRVLYELEPLHEAWAGIDLKPHTAYGFRLYQNESSLLMHVDKSDTHIISCILHIDSSDDAEDWPIVIEDFYGNTNEVVLTPGDMLFYESSKCFHGRPSKFIGSWYSSIFVNYYPADPAWMEEDHHLEGHYGVPLNWHEEPDWEQQSPTAEVIGTSLREPECEDNWCELQNSVKWKGPAEFDYIITTDRKYKLFGGDDEEDEEEL